MAQFLTSCHQSRPTSSAEDRRNGAAAVRVTRISCHLPERCRPKSTGLQQQRLRKDRPEQSSGGGAGLGRSGRCSFPLWTEKHSLSTRTQVKRITRLLSTCPGECQRQARCWDSTAVTFKSLATVQRGLAGTFLSLAASPGTDLDPDDENG